jgi:phage protein D
MTSPETPKAPGTGATAETAETAETAWQRKRRLAAIFGDVLPEGTSDDRDESAGESGTSEEWLRRQVPPHHG